MKSKLVSLFVLITLLAGASGTPAIDPAYQQSFDKWKAEQVDDLKKNWLVLAGLFWLKPGDNIFGSDAASAIVFPKG